MNRRVKLNQIAEICVDEASGGPYNDKALSYHCFHCAAYTDDTRQCWYTTMNPTGSYSDYYDRHPCPWSADDKTEQLVKLKQYAYGVDK